MRASLSLVGWASMVVASLVSSSWEREVILRDWGRGSEHANEPLSTSHFQILKHLKQEGEAFWPGRFHGRTVLGLSQESLLYPFILISSLGWAEITKISFQDLTALQQSIYTSGCSV